MFDATLVRKEIVESIKTWFDENGFGCNAVIGISGGKDSTIVAALCIEALGKDRVIGVLLPNGIQSDLSDSIRLCNILDINYYIINIAENVKTTYEKMLEAGIPVSEQTMINVPPRERTKFIRAICQSMNGRMMNTCNLSEDYIGYFTIGGDGDGDFAPLGSLTCTEVIEIGKLLGLPLSLIEKTPSDGLCGKTDEDSFGFTYEVLDKYIRTGICEDETIKALINRKHEINKFKLEPIAKYEYRGDK